MQCARWMERLAHLAWFYGGVEDLSESSKTRMLELCGPLTLVY